MASIVGKKQGGQTYYYLVESARVDGKPRIVSQQYLGSAAEVTARLAFIRKLNLPRDMLSNINPAWIEHVARRVSGEKASEMRRHTQIRQLTLYAVYLMARETAMTDAMVELLVETVRKITTRSKRKVVGDIATMNQALIAGEIDFHMTGGTYSASPARADGHQNIRGITPLKGPLEGGKGGISWIEVTSTVNNPDLSPLAVEFLKHVQDPEVAHTVAFAEGTFNPVAQMANPDCFKLFSKDELDAIQWDTLDEEMARSVEYDVVPDYDKLLEIMNSAKREVSGG